MFSLKSRVKILVNYPLELEYCVSIQLLFFFFLLYLKTVMFIIINQREFLSIPHPAIIEQTGQHKANMVLMKK